MGDKNRIKGMVADVPDVATNEDYSHQVDLLRRTKDKVAIVGFTDHREQALELDPDEWELWGLNELYRYMPVERFTRWFEIHYRDELGDHPDGEKHLEDLQDLELPIYMHQPWEDIPASCSFPKEWIEQTLDSNYFTSTPAWMVGLAIAMGFEEIHVYGVDMAQQTEWAEQRNCCEYWLGFANGKGIKTYVPPTSDLLKSIGQYGFGRLGGRFAKKLQERLAWLHNQDNDRLAGLRQLEAEYNEKKPSIEMRAHQIYGAIQEMEQQPESEARGNRLEELHKAHNEQLSKLRKLNAEYEHKKAALLQERNQIVGAIQDCDYWKRSWAVPHQASAESPVPDRSKDPRTGITAPAPSGDTKPAETVAA